MQSFKESLSLNSPPSHFSPILKSLWYDAKGNWHEAHTQVEKLGGQDAAWVHAYLHRKECDIWNADYWYTRANKTRPDLSLEQEWESLVTYFTK